MFEDAFVFFFKQKTAYEVRISDWSSDVCSSDLIDPSPRHRLDLIPNFCEARPVLALAFIMAVVAAVLTLSSSAVGEPALQRWLQIGRASCRERVCQYV